MTTPKDDEWLRQLTGAASADQAAAGARQVAGIVATYHAALLQALPRPLAERLLQDFHRLYWQRVLFPNAPPPLPSQEGQG